MEIEPSELDLFVPYKFHDNFHVYDCLNGLNFNGLYVPEEVVTTILSYIDPISILNYTTVCKKWCNIIKSQQLWYLIYLRRERVKPKKLPWYVFYCFFTSNAFNRNLIQNGNGENEFEHWTIMQNIGDKFKIEDPPCGSDALPKDADFNNHTSCFVTSYARCKKMQKISFRKNNLLQLVITMYKPHIAVSEWVAGRFDCGCAYNMTCILQTCNDSEATDDDFPLETANQIFIERVKIRQGKGGKWAKVKIIIRGYDISPVTGIVFQHEGVDTQYWAGHYGSKMAGAVVKILFDTVKPLQQ